MYAVPLNHLAFFGRPRLWWPPPPEVTGGGPSQNSPPFNDSGRRPRRAPTQIPSEIAIPVTPTFAGSLYLAPCVTTAKPIASIDAHIGALPPLPVFRGKSPRKQ